jgi:hypothetical protein
MLTPYDEQVKAILEDPSLDAWYKAILIGHLTAAYDAARNEEQERQARKDG